MTDILTQAKLRDREALERCAFLQQYFAARKGVKTPHAPLQPQIEPPQQPSKPEARVFGRLTFIGRLWRVSNTEVIKPKRGEIWERIYK